ncbi:uncharacterized protein LOC123301440 [Chrysoperla carnea]|uniref:uncharacterized protein LOC123301440 n=1 Tax=Chrysoperla carnea TaxID=189513 RepID=UPI001D0623D2|nr:uncharacterized protein LOC123301440 [Chrysoperla carnea]
MGDFNAKVGKGEDRPAIGPYGLDESREALLEENTTNSPYLPVLLEEFEKAVEELGIRKACGEGGVFAEYLKCLDSNSMRELQNLCQVTTGCGNTEDIRIEKGVRQGCVLSPIFFNVYAEHIINEAIENLDIGVKFNGVRVNNLRYADDTVLLSSSEGELQTLISKVAVVSKQYGLKLNVNKKISCMAGLQEEENEQHGSLQSKDSQISTAFMN